MLSSRAVARQLRRQWTTSSAVLFQQRLDSNHHQQQQQQRRWLGRKGGKMGKHLETLKELAHSESHRQAQERHKKLKQKKKKQPTVDEEASIIEPHFDETETEFEQDDELPEMPDPQEVKERMTKVVTAIQDSFQSIRGAEPSPQMFDFVTVKAYGEDNTPLASVAQAVIVSPTLATVTCFDPSLAKDVKTAIMTQLEGLNPQVEEDGVLRVPLPRPSAESRKRTVQQLGQQAEAGRIRIRNIRRAALEVVKKGEKGKLAGISKDDAFRVQKEIEAVTESAVQQLNQLVKEKQDSVMVV